MDLKHVCIPLSWRGGLPANAALAMRLTTLFLFACFLHVSARGYTQQFITISETNAPIEKVFDQIRQQSGYAFWYDNSLLGLARPVSISLSHATLEETMAATLADQPFSYRLERTMIVIELKNRLSLPPPPPHDLKGKVLNQEGEPLVGATVAIKSSTRRTQTDANGEFNFADADAQTFIVISNVGYVTQEIPIEPDKRIFIRLVPLVNKLDEVQVVAYGTTTQRFNTGSISKVSAEEIAKEPVSNPLEALEGRMPGVFIQQTSGVSGSGFNIEVRGLNSLRKQLGGNNGNLPLIIVDGIPFLSSSLDQVTGIAGQIMPLPSALNAINPSDIESIEVLKDADATAIYGSRGANGVVLITTKKGKSGKTKIDINAYTGAGQIDHQMDLLDSRQYLQMRHEAFQNDAETPDVYDYDLNGTWDTAQSTDWQKTLIGGTAHINSIQATLSGGTQHTQFIVGGGYFKESTVFPGKFADQKGSAHFSLNHSSENKKLAASFSASFVSDINNLPTQDPSSLAITFSPVAPRLYNSDGTLNWADGSWQNSGDNPLALLLRPYKATTHTLIGNGSMAYTIYPGLQLKTTLGYTNVTMDQTSLNPISSQNPAYSPTGFGTYGTNNYSSWIIEPQVEYRKDIFGGRLTALAGATFQQNTSNAQAIAANGFTSDALLNNLSSAPNVFPAALDYSVYKYNAFFGRVNYILKERYLLNITGRRDGSSRFGPGRQFANFGAVGAGWIFSKEALVQKAIKFLSYGKLRGSYGLTGSDQIPDYGFLDTYAATRYPYNGTPGLTINRLFNADYAWESNKKLEIAIELGMLNDRILFNISYYRHRSSNQLVGYPLPAITGQTSLPFYNLPATVQNTGWEFEVHTKNIQTKKFEWSTSFNVTFPSNKLISYPNLAASSYANTYEVGKSIYVSKGFHFTGVSQQNGTYQFEDVNKDGQVSYPEDLSSAKEIAKSCYGGLTNTIKFGNFDFSFLVQFVKQTALNYISAYQIPGTLSNQPTDVLKRWQSSGDRSPVQRFTRDYGSDAANAYFNAQLSDNTISDASFVRLRNVSLSYQFPASFLSRSKIQNLRVYVQAQNLVTLTGYNGLDPETQSFYSIPPLRLFTGGIQITL